MSPRSKPNKGRVPWRRNKKRRLKTCSKTGSKISISPRRRSCRALKKMSKAAESEESVTAFENHYAETETQIERLEQVFELLEKKPAGKKCPAILGILEEGEEIMKEYKGSPALDAGLIAAAQAVEHYEIVPLRRAEGLGQRAGNESGSQTARRDAERGDQDRQAARPRWPRAKPTSARKRPRNHCAGMN